MDIYLVWQTNDDIIQTDNEPRLVTVCDNLEKARQYRDSLMGSFYITKETMNATIAMETVE